ncbi:alpha/beta-hydrolase [Cristinia sonorae]|uniref:Alpha/beta-hydrolase n=1 Tax=Cristinia sonorae TaxID=1940300 RepID=A0A8K0UGS8_9AGAR|nr:alpha/beta-hydrolase [Cristinia sonorae]
MHSWLLLFAFTALVRGAVVPVSVPSTEPQVDAVDIEVSRVKAVAASVVTVVSAGQLASFSPYTQFARAAYCPSEKLTNWNCGDACAATSGFVPTLTGGDGNGVQRFYVGYWPSQNSIVVSHQGLDRRQFLSLLTAGDIFQDQLDPALFPGVPSSIGVHGGFAEAHGDTAETILAETKKLIASRGATTVTLVGHSLGGAIAALDAIYLKLHLPSNIHIKVVTYGLPRVGNAAWVSYFDSQIPDFVRINNKKDPVPILPGRGLGFGHTHGEIHLNGPGNAVACEPNDNADDSRCTITTVPNIFVSNIDDHRGPYEGISIGSSACV